MNVIVPIELNDLPSVAPLPAQKIAAALENVTHPETRRLVWLLHAISHQEGGLQQFAFEMLQRAVPDKLGTPAMRAAGVSLHRTYDGETYEKICNEIDDSRHRSRNKIEGDIQWMWACDRYDRDLCAELEPHKRRATGKELIEICRNRSLKLPQLLRDFCLSPSREIQLPHFEGVMQVLQATIEARREASKHRIAQTSIATKVADVLRYCYQFKTLGVIEGTERLGKSKGVRAWQECNADCARLIDLTAGTTDQQFYQEIWKAIGCSEAIKGDSGELRLQIRAATQNRDLMLIFDEAHCLFGLSQRASMKRLEYLRTEFVNRGIPVVLVVTPQFTGRIQDMERTTGFNTNQFRGRIMKWARLRSAPTHEDLALVARLEFPEASQEAVDLFVAFASAGDAPFARLQRAILEAKDLAANSGGSPTDCETLRQALGYSLSTSNSIDRSLPQPKPTQTSRMIRRSRNVARETPIEPTPSASAPLRSEKPFQRICNDAAPTLPNALANRNHTLTEVLTG